MKVSSKLTILLDMFQVCWTGVLARTCLIVLLLWDPNYATADSDEEIESEWTLWKHSNGVAYDEDVSQHTDFVNDPI